MGSIEKRDEGVRDVQDMKKMTMKDERGGRLAAAKQTQVKHANERVHIAVLNAVGLSYVAIPIHIEARTRKHNLS